jgi:hypothetical protein
MIYLSGAMQAEKIGLRKDLGVMEGYRADRNTANKRKHFVNCLWAADNGCFTNPDLDEKDYLKWLKELADFRTENNEGIQQNCLFAVAPDVVADAKATIERSAPVLPLIRKIGYEAAFVAQDGQESLTLNWDSFDCLFIGGSTEWKCSDASFYLIREAVKKGKWVHVGRVNSMRRILWARFAGAHSTDGTTLAFAPDRKLLEIEKWLELIKYQPVFRF